MINGLKITNYKSYYECVVWVCECFYIQTEQQPNIKAFVFNFDAKFWQPKCETLHGQ